MKRPVIATETRADASEHVRPALVLITALAVIAFWSWSTLTLVRAELGDDKLRDVRAAAQAYECVGNALLDQLPKTTTKIKIDVSDELWLQRLTEIAYPRHDIVADSDNARYIVHYDPSNPDCKQQVQLTEMP